MPLQLSPIVAGVWRLREWKLDSAGLVRWIEQTSAVHFVRVEFSTAQRQEIRAGAAVTLGCDHRNYPSHVRIAPETLASLAGDLRA